MEALRQAGITQGCGSNNFCPDWLATRWETAAFVFRGMGLSDAQPTGMFHRSDRRPGSCRRSAGRGVRDEWMQQPVSSVPPVKSRGRKSRSSLPLGSDSAAMVPVPQVRDAGPPVDAATDAAAVDATTDATLADSALSDATLADSALSDATPRRFRAF